MPDFDELVPIACVQSGKYLLEFKNGQTEERWITKGKAYLMLNNLRHYDLVSMSLL